MNLFKQALIACAAGTMMFSCTDAPEYPVGELYQEAFIKQFGKIPADREWNLAQQMSVTVNPIGTAQIVQVYAQCGEAYYRVALFVDVVGETKIPFDAPAGTTNILVQIDRDYYLTHPGTTVNPRYISRGSRGSEDKPNPTRNILKFVKNSSTTSVHEPQIPIGSITGLATGTTYVIEFDIYSTASKSIRIEAGLNESNVSLTANTWKHVYYEFDFTESPGNDIYALIQIGGRGKYTEYLDNIVFYKKDDNTSLLNSGKDYTFDGLTSGTTLSGDNWYWDEGSEDTFSITSEIPANIIAGTESGNGSSSTTVGHSGNVLKFYKSSADVNIYNPQLNFLPVDGLKGGKDYVVEFDIYSTVSKDVRVEVQNHSSVGRTYNIGNAETWYHVTYEFKLGADDATNNILIQIGGALTSGVENYTEYIDNITIKEKDSGTSIMPTDRDGQFTSYEVNTNLSHWAWGLQTGDALTVIADPTISGGGEEPTPGTGDDPTWVQPTDVKIAGNMAWLVCCEDLGATDDIDFNDIIIRLEYLSTNLQMESNKWNVIENEYKIDLGEYPSILPSRGEEPGVACLIDANSSRGVKEFLSGGVKVTAMAAGGTLDVFLHYYNNKTNVDYAITHQYAYEYTGNSTIPYEWHLWFTDKPKMSDFFGGSTTETVNIMINTDCEYNSNSQGKISAVAIDNPENKDYTNKRQESPINLGFVSGVLPSDVLTSDFTLANFSKVEVSGDYTHSHVTSGFYVLVESNVETNSRPSDRVTYVVGDGDAIGGFGTQSGLNYNLIGQTEKGKAPQMFMIPDVGSDDNGWAWPSERADIRCVYHSFGEWVSSGNTAWYREAPSSIPYRNGMEPYADKDYHGSTGYINRKYFETR